MSTLDAQVRARRAARGAHVLDQGQHSKGGLRQGSSDLTRVLHQEDMTRAAGAAQLRHRSSDLTQVLR